MTVYETPDKLYRCLMELNNYSQMKIALLVFHQAGLEGTTQLSDADIIRETGLSYPSVERAIVALKEMGYIAVESRAYRIGSGLKQFLAGETENPQSSETLTFLSGFYYIQGSKKFASFYLLEGLKKIKPLHIRSLESKEISMLLYNTPYIHKDNSEINREERSSPAVEVKEILGSGVEEKPREVYSTASGRSEKYKAKKNEEFNAVDMCYYFRDRFRAVIKVPYSKITNKERKQAKDLIEAYGAENVVKTIDYLLAHSGEYISGYPSIAVLFGWRNTLFPAAMGAKAPKNPKTDVRESKEEVVGEGEVKVGW